MKLKWTKRALRQLINTQNYIAEENPQAAEKIGERINAATKLLLTQPRMGREGRVKNTREWVVKDTPYFLVYVVNNDVLQILRVMHGKQHWPLKAR